MEEGADCGWGVVGVEVGWVSWAEFRRGGVLARWFKELGRLFSMVVGELALLGHGFGWVLRLGVGLQRRSMRRRGVLNRRFAREDVTELGVFFVFGCCKSPPLLATRHVTGNFEKGSFGTNCRLLLDIVASGFAPFVGGCKGFLPFFQFLSEFRGLFSDF